MKFFIDENSHLEIASVLTPIYHDHSFLTFQDEGLAGLEDIPLFIKLRELGYDGLITNDKGQLRILEERQALIANRLHWIGHKRVAAGGLKGRLLTVAGVVGGFPFIMETLQESGESRAFQINGIPIDRTQRIKEVDLQKST